MPVLETAEVVVSPEELRLETESSIEFANGQVEEKPVSREGSEVALTIGSILRSSGRKSDGWRVFDSSLGYKVYPEEPEKTRKPDVSAVLRSRLAGRPDEGFSTIAADLVVEVVSPHDNAFDLELKVKEYLAHGFRLVWVVYPPTRSVYTHSAGGEVDSFEADDTISGGDVLPGFSCKVSEFFET